MYHNPTSWIDDLVLCDQKKIGCQEQCTHTVSGFHIYIIPWCRHKGRFAYVMNRSNFSIILVSRRNPSHRIFKATSKTLREWKFSLEVKLVIVHLLQWRCPIAPQRHTQTTQHRWWNWTKTARMAWTPHFLFGSPCSACTTSHVRLSAAQV
jgi:hypothetical protein